jgi:VWFA-related protein
VGTHLKSAALVLLVLATGLGISSVRSTLAAQPQGQAIPSGQTLVAGQTVPAQGGATQAGGAQVPPQGQPAAQGQAAAQGQQPPVFRTGVNFVRVDVIVSDKQGQPVKDLKVEDFEIVEDGKVQTIELFKIINTNGYPTAGAEPARPIRSRFDQESEAARDDVRLFVFFLDDYHVRQSNSMRVREMLANFVRTQIGPLDMVAIMYPLSPVTDLGLTRDHEQIIGALRKFEGRKYDYRPRNAAEEKYVYYLPQSIETIRNQVTISAIEGLAIRLGSLREGRKAVIFVSEGFTALLPPQLRSTMGLVSPMAGENAIEDRTRFYSEMDIQTMMRDVYTAANRNNTAFYTLDPRGLATGEFDISENVNTRVDSTTLTQTQGTLRSLAEETDGRAIINQNDLAKGLKQIVTDSSTYYLLGYNSSSKVDGKFHKVGVKVKRSGVQTRSRNGYWAASEKEAAEAAAPPKPRPPAEVEKALGLVEGRPRNVLTASWMQMRPGEDGKTRVTFVWEPVPASVGVTRQEPVAMRVLAIGPRNAEYFRGRVPDAEEASRGAGPTPAAGAAATVVTTVRPARVTFDAPPGLLTLRLAVEDAAGQIIDTSIMEVTVPDLTTLAVRVFAPAFFRARTAREYQALTRDPDPVPTALREFRRTDRLLIRINATAPGTAPPALTAQLLNRVGKPMSDLVVKAPSEGVGYYQIDLPLAGLAAGDYVIEVSAPGNDGKVSELVAIHVTS